MHFSRESRLKILVLLFTLPVLTGAIFNSYYLFVLSKERTQIKKDYAEVNSIVYGLLSVDRWRDNIAHLVAAQIDQFKLSGEQEKVLKQSLNEILNSLITKAEEMINEKQTSLGDKIKKLAFKTFVDVDRIRKKVPEFSQTIIDEIKNPKNKKRLKFLANDKLEEMAEETRDVLIKKSQYDEILTKYGFSNLEQTNTYLVNRMHELQRNTYEFALHILACVFTFILFWLLFWKRKSLHRLLFVMSVIMSFLLLYVGLTLPMIEIDARIKEVNFLLMNQNIVFKDQVIFFQSKSILDVVQILLRTKKIDSIFVGFLLLNFSVLFPMAKLLSTEFFLLGEEKWKKSKIVQFFAFKSGKWSMADVMVVAIFMAYVGFNGILNNQLQILNTKSESLTSIATNYTSLQPGFFLFLTFVIFGLILSEILKKITGFHPSQLETKSESTKLEIPQQ